jgi:hypothetical protein
MLIFVAKILWSTTHAPQNAYMGAPQKRVSLLVIQGPKQPGNDIDMYLRPLVDELLQLWAKLGVRVWNEHKQEEFDLRALLFITTNDWPALSNISG